MLAAIGHVLLREKLVCTALSVSRAEGSERLCLLPNYVNVQGRYKEGGWCGGYEIQEPCFTRE